MSLISFQDAPYCKKVKKTTRQSRLTLKSAFLKSQVIYGERSIFTTENRQKVVVKGDFLGAKENIERTRKSQKIIVKGDFLAGKLRLVLSRYYSSAKDRITSIIRKISLSRLFLIFPGAYLMKVLDTLILHLARLESLAFGVI